VAQVFHKLVSALKSPQPQPPKQDQRLWEAGQQKEKISERLQPP